MEETTNALEITLHSKQFEAFQFDKTHQYCAAIAGVRGGKTFVGALWAGTQIQNRPGDGMICAPTYKILQQATLPTFFRLFPQLRKYYKEQKNIIELPEKNIYIRSMDAPLSAEGITAAWAWGDEAGQYPLLAWTVLRSRTSLVRGPIFLTTTPYNMGWLYQDFYEPATKGFDKDMKVVTWASADNPYFPQEFAEKEKMRLKPEEFKRRYLGEFSRMSGLVYELSNRNRIEPMKVKPELVLGGVDWGFTNPAALTVIQYADGEFYVVDEWYETGKTTQEIIDKMIALTEKWGVRRWYADSANPEKILESQTKTGLNVVPYDKGSDAITAGIGYIYSLIKEGRFKVFNTLKSTLAEFESYHYPEQEDGRQQKELPDPTNNHLMDAIRYAIHGYKPAFRTSMPNIREMSPIDVLLANKSPKKPGLEELDYQ